MFTQIFNLPTKVWDPTEGLEITGVNPAGMGGANSDMVIALGLAGRILGQLGWAARPLPAAAVSAGEGGAVAAPRPVSIGAASAAQSAEAKKAWIKAIGIGLVASVIGAVAAAFLNTAGYTRWWSVGEAVPIGALAGIGMWFGVKNARPIPGRFAIFFNAMAVATVCCGLLFGLRAMKGEAFIVERHKPQPKATPVAPPSKRPELPPELLKKIQEQKEKQRGWDVDDVNAAIIILTHWLSTGALAMVIVWVQFSFAAQKEARQAWSKTTTTGAAE
jgi:hypothetical protein